MKPIKEIVSKHVHEHLEQREMPCWLDPMLATLTKTHFDDRNWIYERKLDGERCIVYCDEEQNIRIKSRNKKTLNEKYPELVRALEKQDRGSYIVDGEIVAFEEGVTSFSKLQKRMHLNDQSSSDRNIDVYLYLFDVLYVDRYDVRDLPLKERKKILKSLFDYKTPIYYTEHRKEHGKEYFKEACEKSWEGLIAKDYDSRYVSSRSKKWLKFKCQNRQEFIVIGYTAPKGDRKGFGAILIGYYEHDRLKYAGKVGTGFDDDMLVDLKEKFDKTKAEENPLSAEEVPDVKEVTWLEPRIVSEIRFTEWTEDGKLRHPSFKGIRDDKNPKDVVNEETIKRTRCQESKDGESKKPVAM